MPRPGPRPPGAARVAACPLRPPPATPNTSSAGNRHHDRHRQRPRSCDRHRAAPCSRCRRARKRTPAVSPGPACSHRMAPTPFYVLRKNGAEQPGRQLEPYELVFWPSVPFTDRYQVRAPAWPQARPRSHSTPTKALAAWPVPLRRLGHGFAAVRPCGTPPRFRHMPAARGDTRDRHTSQAPPARTQGASPCHHRASGPHRRTQALHDRISGAMREPASRERFVPN